MLEVNHGNVHVIMVRLGGLVGSKSGVGGSLGLWLDVTGRD